MFEVREVINDGKNFLVLRVYDQMNDREEIAYVSRMIDLRQKLFTREDLQMIWGDQNVWTSRV